MVQAAFPATALLTRLQTVLDDRSPGVMASAQHPAGTFRNGIAEVFTLIVHETDGWPSRNKASSWVTGYTSPHSAVTAVENKNGGGPQMAVAADGTVAQVMGLPFLTWHAEFLNGRSLGIETGHGNDGRSGDNDIAPDTSAGAPAPREHWRPLSNQAEDIPGAKLFCMDQNADIPSEVLICWWSSSLYTTRTYADYLIPVREPPGSPANFGGSPPPPHPTLMVFSEAHYRSWSLVARYLCEAFLVPRNVPLFPWLNRDKSLRSPAGGGSPDFRLMMLADPNFTSIRDDLSANVASFNQQIFDPANLAAFRTAYNGANVGAGTITEPIFNLHNNNKALNKAWLYQFKSFRGVCGHGFAGSAVLGDHDCPGGMFDWYRFARELYDWWWYPFDFDDQFATTAVPNRAVLRPRPESSDPQDTGPETPLIEYFWENTPTDGRPDPYQARATRPPGGILGQTASPDTFRLEANTPVYAMANGELVAARILQPGAGVNLSFVLIRHEVFHILDLSGWQQLFPQTLGTAPGQIAATGRIDYATEPSAAYSLYMHLGGADQFNFDQPVAANPTWLNRVLVRKKECDLAIDDTGALNAALQAMPQADFTVPPPQAAGRPDAITLFRLEQDRLTTFMNHLRNGEVAPGPAANAQDNFGPTPIKVLLSDFLGTAGVTRVTGGTPSLGVLVEVFSPTLIEAAFAVVPNKTSWDPGAATTPAIRYVSEWGRALTQQETSAATAAGVADPALMNWWSQAVANLVLQTNLAADHRLPADANVYHYAPLDFIRWLNTVTWKSEWPKYKVIDGGQAAQMPAKPPARRVT